MQISGRDGVVTSQAFGQGCIQRDLLLRLRDINKPGAGKACNLLRRSATLGIELCLQHSRVGVFAVLAHDPQDAFHGGALAVSGSRTIEDEQTFHPRITGQGVSDGFLQIVGSRLIPLHDLCDESPPARAVCFRVIDDRGHLCEVVVRAVFPELHRPQIQRSVLAVEQVDIPVVVFHGQWEHRLCILQHGFPMLSELELPHPVDESLSGIFLCDRQGKHIQLVCQQLR